MQALDIDKMRTHMRIDKKINPTVLNNIKRMYENNPEKRPQISLKEIVGSGYNRFWNWKGRYRVVKGSRASKKSKTAALWVIAKMMEYNTANTLVIRKYFSTLRDSFFAELKWAINRLGVQKYWHIKETPLEMTYKPTGQKILFRGLDSGFKITSIVTTVGSISWVIFEEAYEIDNEDDFNIIDESVRGESKVFKQMTLLLNPWSARWWGKKRFFDDPDSDTLAITTNYKCNEWLDESDKRLFESMRIRNPKRYRVAGLGEWGVEEGLVYERWDVAEFNWEQILKEDAGRKLIFGLDWGYNDPTAFIAAVIDTKSHMLWIFDELYRGGLTNPQIYDILYQRGWAQQKIVADSQEKKSIAEMRDLGMYRIIKCRKGHDSINFGIQQVQDFMIIVHPRCVHTQEELSLYAWEKNRAGEYTGRATDKNNHLMDALRYAVMDAKTGPMYSFD